MTTHIIPFILVPLLLSPTALATTLTDIFDDGVPGLLWRETIDRVDLRERNARLEFRSTGDGGGLRFSGYEASGWRFDFTRNFTIRAGYRVAGVPNLSGNRYVAAGICIDPAGPIEQIQATVRRDENGLCVAYGVWRNGKRIAFERAPISNSAGQLTVRHASGADRLLISIDDTVMIRIDDFLADMPTGNGTASVDIGAFRRGPIAWSWGKVHLKDFECTGQIDGPPAIDVWYGSNQRFGHLGVPQHWVNILGNVSDPDGVESLTYRLNGGPEEQLFIGSNRQRLYLDGDFNVDLSRYDLAAGANEVVIRAIDTLGYTSEQTVTVNHQNASVWPIPYSVDWSELSNLLDAAQPVDGRWVLENDGVRIIEPGFDRLLAIGDVLWTDYEVTAPITIHSVDFENGFQPPSNSAGVGFLLRWAGHAPDQNQPYGDYTNFGAITWYQWSPVLDLIRIGSPGQIGDQIFSSTPGVQFGNTYVFKARVRTTTILGFPHGRYKFKYWLAGDVEPDWMLEATGWAGGMTGGSFLLIAHHVDATFGDVTVVPLGN